MKFTKQIPDEDGYYFIRNAIQLDEVIYTPVEVCELIDDEFYFMRRDSVRTAASYRSEQQINKDLWTEFAGPIPLPGK